MIVEYTRYHVADEQRSTLERAYERAQSVFVASPHGLSYELSGCIEDPTSSILRREWNSAQGYLKGFRGSPEFQTFFEAVRPFLNTIQEMRHYEVTRLTGKKE